MSFLIEQAKHDPKAFAKLYEVYVGSVYQYCAYRLPSTQEAEDATSEVWETALLHIAELRSDHPVVFKAWLLKIAQNNIHKRYREKKPSPLNETTELVPDQKKNPMEQSHDTESNEQLRKLVNALPEKQRETVALHFFSELKNKEIAKVLDLSEKTVASNLCRALDTLHTWLKKLQ